MIRLLLFSILLAIYPASADPFVGTTLSFLTSDQVAACPDAASAPTFHTAVDIPDGDVSLCVNVDDIFTHPDRTNITVQNVNILYSLTNAEFWNNTGNFSGIRYTNAYADPNKAEGHAEYWIDFYSGEDCPQEDEPMTFDCPETQGKCYQNPFNIASFLLRKISDQSGGCSNGHERGDTNMGNNIRIGYGIPVLMSVLIAFLVL